MLDDVVRHSGFDRSRVVFWIGNTGKGLGRLISSADFNSMSNENKINTLSQFEGYLPSKDGWSNMNAAFITTRKHKIFFRPDSVRGKISELNAGDFVKLGVGFSYSGLRSYHESIHLVGETERRVKKEFHLAEKIDVKVIGHNSSWVECVAVDNDNQPVLISRNEFDDGCPVDGERLRVILMETRDYTFYSHNFDRKPFRAELIGDA